MPIRVAVLLLASLFASPAFAQDGWVDIEKRLSSAQLRETGLDQLSPAQLQRLNELLRTDRADAVQADRVSRPAPEPRIEKTGRIAGTFRGWEPGTVLTLENGEQWRVVSGQLFVRAMASPVVHIKPGAIGGWYLRVEGQSPVATVRQVTAGR